MKKRKINGKKLGIVLGVIGGIIGVCVILCFTLFSLKNVSVNFHTSTYVLAGQEEQIVESGEFSYGGSVIFLGKRASIEKIERTNPYVKVVNIETVFPSSYIIHCVERQEVYAIELNDKTYICDEEFKVLRIIDGEYEGGADKPILYKGLRVANSNAEAGEFLNIENAVDVFNGFVENNRLLHEQKSLIKEIEVGKLLDENINKEQAFIKLSLYDGQTYLIKNATYGFNYKIAKMISVYSNIYSIIGEAIDKELPAEGDNVWTAEKIKNSTIEINNYYRTDLHEENECYFKVIPPQNSIIY